MDISITVATTVAQIQAARRFVKKRYRTAYNVVPTYSDSYLIALCENTIIGTIALEFSKEGKEIPLFSIYSFNKNELPTEANSVNSVQVGRWIADKPEISIYLLYASTIYAQIRGKPFIWFTMIDASHKLLQKYGVQTQTIPSARIISENVPRDERNYYLQAPAPKCYVVDAKQTENNLEPKIQEISADKNNTITLGKFFTTIRH